ncbi:MAG: DUF4136 domain-containing protein, partial [Cyclobacteriaceae bacterium]
TEYDNTANFASYSTYTLTLDTLGFISNNSSDTLILDEYATLVTSKIKSNMDSRGYNFVSKNQNPDLSINAFVVNDFNVFQTISYPSYGSGFYSSYYDYYYPIVNTYASNSAILIIQIVDLNKKNTQNQFQVLWSCYIGDIISSPDPFNQFGEAVDQAFAQTPIIGK